MNWSAGAAKLRVPKAPARLVRGGRGGIRTHETLARLAVFKTAAFNHSATLPEERKKRIYRIL